MVEYRDPTGAVGSRVSAELAADLKSNKGAWAILEEHPLPVSGNEEQKAALATLEGVSLPATAQALYDYAQSNGADATSLSLLKGAAQADAKRAKEDKPVKTYADSTAIAKAILEQQTKRVRAKASSRTGVIKAGRGAFAPEGSFDSLQRTENGESGRVVRVFAKYLGTPEVAAPAAPAFPEPASV